MGGNAVDLTHYGFMVVGRAPATEPLDITPSNYKESTVKHLLEAAKQTWPTHKWETTSTSSTHHVVVEDPASGSTVSLSMNLEFNEVNEPVKGTVYVVTSLSDDYLYTNMQTSAFVVKGRTKAGLIEAIHKTVAKLKPKVSEKYAKVTSIKNLMQRSINMKRNRQEAVPIGHIIEFLQSFI
jgi:hypothetical protein